MKNSKFKYRFFTIVVFLILSILAFLFMLPIGWWISFAIRGNASISVGKTIQEIWIPDRFLLIENLRYAFSLYPMGRFFLNSFLVSSAVTFFELLLASMAGYAFAKYRFLGRDVIFKLVLALLMVPQIVLVIPLFELFTNFSMINKLPSLVIPFLVTPFGIFMMRQFMYGLPDDYIEAARIEGANEFLIFFRIIMPLTKNALAVLGIFTFLMQWDSLLWPLIVLSKQKMYTLAVGISLLQTNVQVPFNSLYAVTLLFSIPVIIFYLLMQNLVMKSLALTGMK